MRSSLSVMPAIAALAAAALFLPDVATARSGDPPDGRTGGPDQLTCADGCHTGNALNSGDGTLSISGLPAQYALGETYPITVTLDKSGQMRWGFELAALSIQAEQAGTIAVTDADSTQTSTTSSITYIKHTADGTRAGTVGPKSWTFDWTAPLTDVGEVTLYAAGNAADNNNSSSGDFIYTTSESATVEQTEVSGVIATTVWTVGNSPYHVTGQITIPSDNTLTIEPGVDVLFDADVRFLVQGAVKAYGTPSDSIRFMAGTALEWGGLELTSLNADTSYLEYVRISDGHAANGDGGGIHIGNTDTNVKLSNCVISGNVADDDGGGVAIDGAQSVSFDRCTIVDNRATHLSNSAGGGIFVASSAVDVTITNCTIASNVAGNPDFGTDTKNGVYVQSGVVTMLNSIVWGRGNGVSAIEEFGGTFTANYCVIDGGKPDAVDGANNLSDDPLFADAAAGDYSLTVASPAINAGDPGSDDDPDGSRADMGALPFDLVAAGYTIGNITTTTWTAANSPYRIFGNTLVPSGNTLTIEPGVDVLFDTYSKLEVAGVLVAVGTEEDSIRFLPGLADRWNALLIRPNVNVVQDTSRLSYVRISGSYASAYGGGLYLAGRTDTPLELEHTVVSGNESGDRGGGIYIAGGDLNMYRCVVANNLAVNGVGKKGGGMWLQGPGATATIDHSNFVNNAASSVSGKAIHASGSGAVVTITNSIFWQPFVGWPSIENTSGTVSVNYCLIDGALDNDISGSNNQVVDPLFTNAASGDYSIPVESPAVNAGDPASDPDPDGSRADIGVIPYDLSASGYVYGDITSGVWTSANSPYEVFDATIPVGNQLTIEEGVVVSFVRDAPFIVDGSINVRGVEGDSVYFEAAGEGDWRGLQIGNGDTSYIGYASITGSITSGISMTGYETRLGLYSSKVSGNTAVDGAGIKVDDADIVIDGCEITGNTASRYGGGVYGTDDCTVIVISSQVSDNVAATSGGGIYLQSGTMATVVDAHVVGNTCANGGGGGIIANSSTVNLVGGTISGNTAKWGAGVEATGSTASVAISRCVVSGNMAILDGHGSGAYSVNSAQVTLDNSTVSGNLQSTKGGGLSVLNSGTITAANSIIWGNGTANLYNDAGSAGTITIAYSDVEGGYEGEGNVDVDPRFVAYDDFRLQTNSPVIDAGDPASPLDADGTVVEMGAYPFVGARFATVEIPNALERQPYAASLVAKAPGFVGALDFAIADGPDWLTIGATNDSTAELGGTPLESDVGGWPWVTISAATDQDTVEQKFALAVYDTNYAPEIDSLASLLAVGYVGTAYADTLRASDPDGGDALTFSLVDNGGISGLTVQDSVVTHAGFVTGNVGEQTIQVRVADGSSAADTVSLVLVIEEPVGIAASHLPSRTELRNAHPNPFNPSIVLAYSLTDDRSVSLTVFDLRGSLVRTLVDGQRPAGFHDVVWDGRDAVGRDVGTGVFVVRFVAGDVVNTQRITLLK